MNLANPKRILLIYLICLSPDIFVHFYNTLLNLLIYSTNVFLCQISEDSGTMWETGFMDCLNQFVNPQKYYGVIGLITDIRLKTKPDPLKSGVDNQSMYINQFVIGGLKNSLGVYTDELELIEALDKIRMEYEGFKNDIIGEKT